MVMALSNQRKTSTVDTRPNQLNHLLEKAKKKNYSNLYLNYKNLEEIPREVLHISSIQQLFLKRNLLKSLPTDLWKLRKLKTLYLPSNKLTYLPEEIGKCKELENLNVDDNFLKSLPKSIGKLAKLKFLQISNNELECFPQEIGKLKSLEVLEIMNNCVQYLPEELSKCTNLTALFADGNKIEEIPTILLELVNLTDIALSRNDICYLPQDLNRLYQLKSLILDNNQDLTVIPATVLKLSKLSILGLYGCGSNKLGQEAEELEQYLKNQGLKRMLGNVETLLELCCRACKKIDIKHHKSFPKCLQMMLQSPKGCCHYCGQSYFTTAFFQLYASRNYETLPVLLTGVDYGLCGQIKDTECYFIFCFCLCDCLNKFYTTIGIVP